MVKTLHKELIIYIIEDKKTPILPGFEDFSLPFEGQLDRKNRWVIKAALLPFDFIESCYKKSLSENQTGAPALNSRIAFCALYIHDEKNISDEETVLEIQESPYLQYFMGYERFTNKKPFDPSMMVHFRKRFKEKDLNRVNEMMVENYKKWVTDNYKDEKDKNDDDVNGGDDSTKANKGKLIVDATCAPQDIKYPNDLDLLNQSREKTEKIIDVLHLPLKGKSKKPRTYRKKARRQYLLIAKNKKVRKKKIRRGIKQQLNYVKRNLKHIEELIKKSDLGLLGNKLYRDFLVIHGVYRQQEWMYKNKTHSIAGRIVSISQPHVRPIVRGKLSKSVEFGNKVSISCVDGFSYVDKLSWDNYNESSILKDQIELYYKRHGCYPKEVLGDKIFRTRDNRKYCKELGIEFSGPPLGRPKSGSKKENWCNEGDRNPVEGKFGEGKRKYGLGKIMGKLPETSEVMIQMIFISMNMNKILREISLALNRIRLFFIEFWSKMQFAH